MRKIISILVLLGAFGLAGCGEYANQIDGTNKILVGDFNGDIDLDHIAKACGGIDKVEHVQYVRTSDGRIAVVECH